MTFFSAQPPQSRNPPEMLALSIKQPWSWLIVFGHKDIENRSWPTRYRGRFLIHAGRILKCRSLSRWAESSVRLSWSDA
jgi:hypothetical protein